MIVGIGVDIASIHRIGQYITRDAFQRRIYTPLELEACMPLRKKAQCLAGKFAAKEAFMKAIGSGIHQAVWFTQIEVLNLETGEPYIKLSGEAERRFNQLKVSRIYVSISHDLDTAVAVVILEK
ncbi:MAG: holo-ACP synthase [Acidobacteriaceae bacterium]